MSKQNIKLLAEKIEKRAERRNLKKHPKVKVSGASVKKLQKVIFEKAKKA